MMAIYAFDPFRLDAKAEMLFRGADPITLGRRAVAATITRSITPAVQLRAKHQQIG